MEDNFFDYNKDAMDSYLKQQIKHLRESQTYWKIIKSSLD